ncbi:FOSLN [Lepeophtheirus salmonis]|uniref:FOSLN n=1 Tax=Lepeophtheirus salmonis TaxID=72036 RepID=A0A7R8H3E7_LEPSM|nr:FOSLN [Lepeophtheirus salmonis]CAF2828738.1 FOSLN [Lepeophtheirus salmonis]
MSREGLRLSLLDNNNSSNGNNNGAPTLTTPTLTPTTLRNIEQMLLDSGDAPVLTCEPPELHENAAGFVPPSVDIPLPEYEDKLQTSLDWVLTQPPPQSPNNLGSQQSTTYSSTPPVPPVIASLIKDPSAAALPGPTNILLPLLSNLTPVSSMNNTSQSIALPSKRSTACAELTIPTTTTSRRNNEKSINDDHSDSSQLTPDEKLKRDLRRERNKEAAARCRKRRLDQTLNLQDEVEELDSKKISLQKELESLRTQKEELELLLKNHKAGHCAVLLKGGDGIVKKEPLENEEPLCIKSELSGLEDSSAKLACTVGGQ